MSRYLSNPRGTNDPMVRPALGASLTSPSHRTSLASTRHTVYLPPLYPLVQQLSAEKLLFDLTIGAGKL